MHNIPKFRLVSSFIKLICFLLKLVTIYPKNTAYLPEFSIILYGILTHKLFALLQLIMRFPLLKNISRVKTFFLLIFLKLLIYIQNRWEKIIYLENINHT